MRARTAIQLSVMSVLALGFAAPTQALPLRARPAVRQFRKSVAQAMRAAEQLAPPAERRQVRRQFSSILLNGLKQTKFVAHPQIKPRSKRRFDVVIASGAAPSTGYVVEVKRVRSRPKAIKFGGKLLLFGKGGVTVTGTPIRAQQAASGASAKALLTQQEQLDMRSWIHNWGQSKIGARLRKAFTR